MPQPKSFDGQNTLTSQGVAWGPLTPADGADLEFLPKAVHVYAGTGVFVAIDEDGTEGSFYGTPGLTLPIRPKRIKSTGLPAGMLFTGLKR